jgi:formylglycine-generating enzyme required for sulfatase activity
MAFKHSVGILQAGSRYVGRKCIIRKTELKVGEQVVVCHKRDEAFSWIALPTLEGRCPYCGQDVGSVGEILGAFEKVSTRVTKSGKKTDKPKPGPQYNLPTGEGTPPIPKIFLAAALILFITLSMIGGYYIFIKPTITSTSTLGIDYVTETSKITKTKAPVIVTPEPLTDTPTPSLTPTVTASATPTRMPSPTFTATPSGPSVGDTWTRPEDTMIMVYVPAGTFTMGSTNDQIDFTLQLCDAYPVSCERETLTDEEPAHDVALKGFWFDSTEVTNHQYSLCVAAGECSPPSKYSSYSYPNYYHNPIYSDYPVIQINWYQAATYCEWVDARLPRESEWEYAARGPDSLMFPWGNTFDSNRLNYCDSNCDFDWRDRTSNDGYGDIAPVGNYPDDASWCGAHDLGGNVWEWIEDEYRYYETDKFVSAGSRVLRSGTWHLGPDSARCANRDHHTPDTTHVSVGFRCAKSP